MTFDNANLELDERKSTIVVTIDTGKVLGNVNGIYFDIQRKVLAALSFRRKYLGREFYLPMDQIEMLGEDVVFVRTETSEHRLTKIEKPLGEDLRNFQGMWVYTRDGRPVAAVTDLGFNKQTWALQTLYFSDNRAINVKPETLEILEDRLVIPTESADKVYCPGEVLGLLAQCFGRRTVEETTIVLQRVLRSLPPRIQP